MKLLTSVELSRLTHVSVRWIEKKCETGEIRAIKDGAREWRIFEAELVENKLIVSWLEGKKGFWSC